MTQSAPDNSAGAPRDPTPAEVRAELERILASGGFEQAGRSSEFLRYVVEQTLAGAGDRLKGYTIAVEVFRRPTDFDAQSDPLVRVEAGRLRRRLLEYYVAEGQQDPVRIELPRGGYTVNFRYPRPTAREPPPEPELPHLPMRWTWRRIRRFGGIVVVVGALIAVVLQNRPSSRSAATEAADAGAASASGQASVMPKGPKILVLPFENLGGDANLNYVADGVTEEIILRLGVFDLFVVAGHAGWYDRSGAPTGEAPAGAAAPYMLTGTVRYAPDRVRISARLVESATGAQLWTNAYDEDLTVTTLLAIQEKIAREVVAKIAVPYGPIYDRELARIARKPAEYLDTYDCVLKYYHYRRAADPALHADTVACFQRAVMREPMFANAWGGLALLYLDEYAYGYTPQGGAVPALERAREAARTALDVDGEAYLGNLALARVRFFSGDRDGFERSAERVLALNPNNPEALALIGTLLALMGQSDRALPLVDKAIAMSPRVPGMYYVAQAVTDLRSGHADAALAAALRFDAPNWFVAPMVVAAAAGLADRRDVAERAMMRLLELYPTFPQHAAEELAKWQLDAPLAANVRRGLRAAGLQIDD